ncbi:MAG TPA: glycosyltransferase family 1 protein [Chloroflexota bacterium]|nr:glycosyltransferase family 1 protein [Chloroflexota bacterium]
MSPTARRVSLNGLFLDYPHSGTWTYTRNLAAAMAANRDRYAVTICTRRAGWEDAPAGIEVRRVHLPGSRRRTSEWYERGDKFLWETVLWPAASGGTGILHSPYFAAPLWSPWPLVVTVHDTISLQPRFTRGRAALVYASVMHRTVLRAAAIITVSQFSKTEIAAALDYPLDRIHVTYEAPDPRLRPLRSTSETLRVRQKYRLPERFALYLGGTERRKNIEVLIHAWRLEPSPKLPLVVVGRFRGASDPLFPDIPALAASLGLGEAVRFVPSVEEADLAAVYSLAEVFCFPSIYEGFGLPPLEAMACGTPVLCSNASSLPEVTGDGALLLPPDDAGAWNRAVRRIEDDRQGREDLAAKGSARVGRFSWEQTAAQTFAVYDLALGG